MTETLYHKLLRIAALTLCLVLVFVSGIAAPITKELSRGASTYVATAIGMNAAVLPTEVNSLSAQLQAREQELNQREIAVELKESAVSQSDMATYILSILLFILLVLIVLNYVLDHLRSRQQELSSAS